MWAWSAPGGGGSLWPKGGARGAARVLWRGALGAPGCGFQKLGASRARPGAWGAPGTGGCGVRPGLRPRPSLGESEPALREAAEWGWEHFGY